MKGKALEIKGETALCKVRMVIPDGLAWSHGSTLNQNWFNGLQPTKTVSVGLFCTQPAQTTQSSWRVKPVIPRKNSIRGSFYSEHILAKSSRIIWRGCLILLQGQYLAWTFALHVAFV